VVTITKGEHEPRLASLKGIMAAKKKPLDVKTAADLGLAGQVGAASAKVKIESRSLPPQGKGAEILQGSNEEVAGVLASKIKELGLL
jgi:electron transfer flavoprotein beta subunit